MMNKNFVVYYQPKVNTVEKRVVGAEALVRWQEKDGTILSPEKFLPIYEQQGKIASLDEYVFYKVCAHQKNRILQGKTIVPISVNVSRISMCHEDIVNRYVKIIRAFDIPFACVPLELTESADMESDLICRNARKLVSAGFLLHMDDFGSGYSSLRSLSEIPFSTLKLDKQLIDCLGTEKGNAVVNHIIAMAQKLQMDIIAEGVETKKQVELLQSMGCYEVQGFYYAKPMPEEQFI